MSRRDELASRMPKPPEECVQFPPDALSALEGSAFKWLTGGPVQVLAATLGPVALMPLRAASKCESKVFCAEFFSPVGWRQKRKMLGDEAFHSPLGDETYRALMAVSLALEPDDEHAFGSALGFVVPFEQLHASALDDMYLVMRKITLEDRDDPAAKLNYLLENTFTHFVGAEPMHKLAEVARHIFPSHKYPTPSDSFFPRPLHVAVLARDLPLAKLLLRFTILSGCDLNNILCRYHTPASEFAVMTPVYLALLVLEDPDWDVWSALLVGASARFSIFDSCIALESFGDFPPEAFEQRVRRVLSLAGTREEELEMERHKFYNAAFVSDVFEEAYHTTTEEEEDEYEREGSAPSI